MEKPPIKLIVLVNQQRLVSQIEEIGADIGQPDCKLTEPFIVGDDNTLSPWLVESTNQSVFMLSSDKILTLVDPKPTLLEKYQDLSYPHPHPYWACCQSSLKQTLS